MYYGEIKNCDIANGTGVRVSLFVSGCTNRCKDCFQKQTWDFNYGKPFTDETQDKIIELLYKPYINGLTLLGGEPFEPANQKDILPFLRKVKKVLPNKSIWAYSGFTFEELIDKNSYAHCGETDEILSIIDVLVDGKFISELKNISLKFRGSENQRIIDVKKTLQKKELVLYDK